MAEWSVALGTSALASIVSTFGTLSAAAAEIVTPWNEHPNAKVRMIAGEDRTLGVELGAGAGMEDVLAHAGRRGGAAIV